jgi:hypothetical protein
MGEREHSAQTNRAHPRRTRDTRRAALRVAVGSETDGPALRAPPAARESIDLAVEGDRVPAVAREHRLPAPFAQVDDREPPVPETDWTVNVNAVGIGASMRQEIAHALDERGVDRRSRSEVQASCNPTHGRFLQPADISRAVSFSRISKGRARDPGVHGRRRRAAGARLISAALAR